jgi:hypothetical protein
MVQGAANYAWNLIEEAWAMIWKSVDSPQAHAGRGDSKCISQSETDTRDLKKELGTKENKRRKGHGA